MPTEPPHDGDALSPARLRLAAEHVATPSRRRPRRADEVTFRVRIDLSDVQPPVWRLVEVGSGIYLDQVHDVVQRAFAWNDSHLHRFAVGRSVWDPDAELYLCPFDVKEGEDEGIPEQDVRLDEVLVEVGDALHYEYDYGDGWGHVLRLEAISDPRDDPTAVCTDGRRAGPPDDCGGPGGYQELVAAGAVDAERFDVDDVNARLSGANSSDYPDDPETAETPVSLFLRMLYGSAVEHDFANLVRDADLASTVLISTDEAVAMVHRYAWLLERVGDTGIKLSAAGWLPPAEVHAAMVELEMTDEWWGKFNRENQTMPVLALRESAQRMGLLRKHRGRLLLTREAQKLRSDPVRLWWHVAGRLPLHPKTAVEHHAGLVSLLGVAAGRDTDAESFDVLVTEVLTSFGWRMADGAPIGPRDGRISAWDTRKVLSNMGAFSAREPGSKPRETTAGGRALARAALQRTP